MPTPMRITAMPETTIDITPDGEIQISQKVEQLGDQIVSFPVELAEKIANEILRLAGHSRESLNTALVPPRKPFPED